MDISEKFYLAILEVLKITHFPEQERESVAKELLLSSVSLTFSEYLKGISASSSVNYSIEDLRRMTSEQIVNFLTNTFHAAEYKQALAVGFKALLSDFVEQTKIMVPQSIQKELDAIVTSFSSTLVSKSELDN